MALTRKYLKAMGIEDEKVDQIVEAHTETVNALKEERDGYKADAEKLTNVQKELDDLKAKADDGYKEKYEKEHSDFEAYKADIESKASHAAKEKAYRELLKSVGIKEDYLDVVMDSRATQGVIEELKLEGDKIVDSDKLANTAKEKWSKFVATTEIRTGGVETPPANNGGSAMTKEQIYAMKNGKYILSSSERQAELAKLYQTQKGK